jgi:hypothetical protein
MSPPGLLADPETDPLRDRLALDALPSSPGAGAGAALLGATLTGKALGFGLAEGRDLLQGQDQNPTLDPEAANHLYGVDGHLKFDKPVSEADAAFRQNEAQGRAWRDEVLAKTDAGPLALIGSSLAGGMLDPVALPLWFAPELVAGRAARTAFVAGRAGRVALLRGAAIGAAEGAAGAGLYESANYGLDRAAAEPYDLGAGLVNIALGATIGGLAGGLHGALGGEPARPRAVDRLTDEARVGALARGLDLAIADEPVRIGELVETEAVQPKGLERLDEARGGEALPQRPLDEATAVTTRGTEIPVRYALVELDSLITSHDDNLGRNPAYPAELQPRERDRAGAQARNLVLEQELNPKRLMRESGAETGAPIVAADGTVESGNGRLIALRRSANTGSGAWGRYQAELAAQGVDASGMSRPVLVRVRTEPMSGDARAALAREMNADVTERLSAPEQAASDAKGITEPMLALLDGTPAGERAFAQRFLQGAGADQQNSFADAEGHLSAEGGRRLKAALTARAYEDPGLTAAMFEASDPNIRTIGAALADAAPAWAQMRALVSRGEVPAELDLTGALKAAVALVRHARDSKIPLGELIAERLGQGEMFGGEALSPEVEAFLRLMFRDEGFKRQRASDKIAWALKDYARQASETKPGPNLFGETPDGDAKLILQGLARRFQGDEAFPEQGDLEALEHRPGERDGPAAADARLDLRPDAGGGGGPDLQQPGVGEAGGDRGGGAGGHQPAGTAGPLADALAADPELKAALEDTEALAGELGVTFEDKTTDPATVAEAVRAAAVCLATEAGG